MSDTAAPVSGAAAAATDSIVLEEEIDPNYVPTEAEVVEYAKWLGMDLDKDLDLFWVAKEGLMAPLPKNWKPCKTKDTEDIYYFNFASGESTWDHPCDGYYKRLFEEEKKKKETNAKESSDQNRTQAKADVEKLLGKDEKKKKKKKGEMDALPAPGAGGKKAGKSAKALSKPALGPIGGSKPLAAAPLPGISHALSLQQDLPPPGASGPASATSAAKKDKAVREPLRASSNTRSDVSLLTLSDSTGASLGLPQRGSSMERESKQDEGGSVSTSGKRSKMASRLSTIVGTSDELQLDLTPTKGPTRESEGKAATLSLPAPALEAKPEEKASAAATPAPAPAPASLSPTKRKLPEQAQERPHQGSHREAQADAKPSRVDESVAKEAGAASPARSSHSFSSSGSESALAPAYQSQSTAGPALAARVAELEKVVRKRDAAVESLRLEQEDAERRVHRACQRQAVAEESEAELDRKVQEARSTADKADERNVSLEKEIRDLRSLLSKRREDADIATDDDANMKAVIHDMRAELAAATQSEKRAVDMQAQLRNEMQMQAKFFETKVRSGELVLAATKEDAARTEATATAALAAHAAELMAASDASAALTEALSAAEAKAAATPTEVKVIKEVEVIREVAAAGAAAPADSEQLAALGKTVSRLSAELSDAKDADADADRRCKRQEGLAASWEADCAGAERRLVASRARANEFEDKAAALDADCHRLQAAAKVAAAELAAVATAAESALRLQREEAGRYKEESAGLRVRLQRQEEAAAAATAASNTVDTAATTAATTDPAATAALELQVAALTAAAADKDAQALALGGEVAALKQRLELATMREQTAQAEMQHLRELHTALKDAHSRQLSASAESSFDGARSEEEVAQWKARWNAANAEAAVQAAEVDRLSAACTDTQRAAAEALEDAARETLTSDGAVRSLKAERYRAQEELARAQTALTEAALKGQSTEEELFKVRREHLAQTSELSTLQFDLGAEKRAREVHEAHKEAHEARHDLQTAKVQELERAVAEREETVSRLYRDLETARSAVCAAAAINENARTIAPAPAYAGEGSSGGGIRELSATVGQQSRAISSLEGKLHDAMDTIGRLKSTPKQEEEGDMDKSLLIREMLQEFVQRRRPAPGATTNSASSAPRGREHWSGLLLQETRFIAEARRALREEKAAIRWEQQQLLRRRDAWKSEGTARSSGTQQLLNQQTLSLNAAVEQARRSGEWLSERERKLASLQRLAAREGSTGTDAQLDMAAAELDADLRGLGTGYHSLPGQSQAPLGGFGSAALLPSQLEQFCQSLGARSSFFPHGGLGSHSAHTQGRNTYMEAQAEGARPLLRRSTSALAAENVPPPPQQQQQPGKEAAPSPGVGDVRKAAREVDGLSREREQAQATYDSHIGWLAGLRKDLTTFQQQPTQLQQAQGRSSGSCRAFIDAVVHDKFEL